MLNRRCVLLVVAGMLAGGTLAFAAPAPEKKEDQVKQELKKLQGSWKAESLEQDGEKAPEKVLARARFEIKDNKMIEKGADNITEVVIDPTTKPRTIDLISEATTRIETGPDGKRRAHKEKETVKGIYTLEGDTLTICLASQRKADRPTKIESGKGIVIAVFKRQKP